METLLQTVHCASVELQNSNVIQSVAVDLINSTKESIEQIRNNTFWENINTTAISIYSKNGIAVEKSIENQRSLTFNKNLSDFFVQSTAVGLGTKCPTTTDNVLQPIG